MQWASVWHCSAAPTKSAWSKYYHILHIMPSARSEHKPPIVHRDLKSPNLLVSPRLEPPTTWRQS